MSRRQFLLVLIGITLIAFALRVGVASHFQGLDAKPDAESNPDQLDYELFAWRVADGQGYTLPTGVATARRPPGTSFALVPVYALCGHSYSAARLFFCAVSAATCLVAGLVAAELGGLLTGLLAAAALAFLPSHFYYAQHFLSEVPYGLAISVACWCALRGFRSETTAAPAPRGTLWLDLATGLAFGFAILTRPQTAFAGPIALLGALLSRREVRGRRLLRIVVVGLASAAVVAPWVVRNQRELGKATLSTVGGFTFWGANNAVIAAGPDAGSWMPVDTLIDAAHPLDGSEIENDASAWRYGFEFIRSHSADVPRLLAQKFVRHFSPFRDTSNRAVYWTFALGWIVLAPLLVAGCVILWRRAQAGGLLVLAPIASTLITVVIFYGSVRFRDAEAALQVVPAAAAFELLLPRRWRTQREPLAA